jgi:RNA polymerase sigma factor (sigma-70 family)
LRLFFLLLSQDDVRNTPQQGIVLQGGFFMPYRTRQLADTGHHPGAPPQAPLAAFERQLQEARARLVQFAQLQGVPAQVAEDVVQETLLTATRILERLWSPEQLTPWLEGICRNLAHHHLRDSSRRARREIVFSDLTLDNLHREAQLEHELAASEADDLAELVTRQELSVLLDRALGYLPGGARKVVELCYLAELPPQEVAARLHITAAALDVRLHRARRQLRTLLNGPLRPEAEAFGLLLNEDEAHGWRDARLWCWGCGQQRLRGIFEPLPGNQVNLRLRCPTCSVRYGKDLFWTKGIVPLPGTLRSFRPAIKRAQQVNYGIFADLLTPKPHLCPQCRRPVQGQVAASEEINSPFPGQYWVVMNCPACGRKTASVGFVVCYTDLMARPIFERFTRQHPRWHAEPTIPVVCEGMPALRIRLAEAHGPARLTFLVHRHTLQVLTYFEE